MTTRVLLIDDNTLFRRGLSALLALQTDLSIVGEAASGKEAAQVSSSLDADVLLIDTRVASASGLDIAAQIKRHLSRIKIVVLTASRTEEHVRTALRMGVDGYVLKDATLEELLLSIRSVAKGKKYLSPDVSGHLVESFLHPEQTSAVSQLDVLTNRERGIMQLIAEGRTNKSAAEFLSVSQKTVEKHRASLMQKLGLRNATEMTLVAMEMGLVERPSSFARFKGNNRQRESE